MGIECLTKSLMKNHDLEYLDISENRFGEEGATRLLELLEKNFSLTYIKADSSYVPPFLLHQINLKVAEGANYRKAALTLLMLRKNNSCILHIMPRRLLIYMCSFLKYA